MRKEWLARLILSLGLAFAVGIPAVGWWQHDQAVVVHAHMAENGGWEPGDLTIGVGEPLHLRLMSDDVMHGFAVGKHDQPAVDVIPGEMTEVTLVFEQPGKYTFYCTHWCSLNHWRMRGTIEVTGQQKQDAPVKPALYVSLGLDIDADHSATVTPAHVPSAWRGALLSQTVPKKYTDSQYYLTHTPLDLWFALRSENSSAGLSDQEVWDLVAWVWEQNTTPAELVEGKELYVANCAACHGENGAGNGVFASQLGSPQGVIDGGQELVKQTKPPADFSDVRRMLSASPAHLQGKLLRGGMGTGMPYWGPIFTEDQTWALIAYLWTFQFSLEVTP